MLGAIIGDIVGSVYEFDNHRTKDFILFSPNCFFTDDSVMTIAVAQALMDCKGDYNKLEQNAVKEMQSFGRKYPNAGYGAGFMGWLGEDNSKPYNSFGNGAAMRISPVAYFAKTEQQVKELSYLVTKISHNHPEGLKGAECTAMAIWLALHKSSKEEIKEYIERNYYSLSFDYENLKNTYVFNETCQNTVPQAIFCFLNSTDFEDAIRTGISIGGDSDTLCAIVGAIAEAYYGLPDGFKDKAYYYLDKKLIKVCQKFEKLKK